MSNTNRYMIAAGAWCAVSTILGLLGGIAVGRYSLPQRTITQEVVKEKIVEVRVEVLPPAICVDVFQTRPHIMGKEGDVVCPHPSHRMTDVVQKTEGRSPWLEITCSCVR